MRALLPPMHPPGRRSERPSVMSETDASRALSLKDFDLSHHAAEVFGVVRQMIEVGAVQKEGAGRLAAAVVVSRIADVENYVERLTAADCDRVGLIRHVVAG